MLDSARTFWSVTEVCELLAVMARYRLNVLHWHLTDDAGWRFAVPGYPRLLDVAAQLPREPFEWYDNVDHDKRRAALDSAPSGSSHGWYSDDDIRTVLQCAAGHGISVLPEVDLPGHMGAVIRAYPNLGDPALAGRPPQEWTHRNDLLWPGDEAEAFVVAALDRVVELFDHPLVHIGGDECDYRVWEADASLMARMAELGTPDARAIQGRFTELARRRLASHGRGIAAWDEVTETPIRGDEVVIGWRDDVGVPAARDSGNPWVFADAALLYLNRLAGPVETEPAGMFGVISPADIARAPVPEHPKLLGVQAAVWCEFLPDRARLHYHLFPRLLAVAELAWSGPLPDDALPDFEERLRAEADWLERHGLVGRPMDPVAATASR
ncbi:family 20 glycosylhydrolase [Tessaracoccus terricola]